MVKNKFLKKGKKSLETNLYEWDYIFKLFES